MILKKALLINSGNKGLELKFDGYRKISDQFMSNFEDHRKDRMPVPLNIRLKFNGLRYFFLTMMGVWPDELTNCLDDYYSRTKKVEDFANEYSLTQAEAGDMIMKADTLLQNCTIIGYEMRGSEIKIIGKFEHIEGKPYKPNLPFINEDDDYSFYQEAHAVVKELSGLIVGYMKEESLEIAEMKKILIELQQNNQQDVERINKQSDEENYLEIMQRLEGQAIVMPLQGSELERMLEEHDDNGDAAKIVSKKTINKSKFEAPEQQENVEEKETDDDVAEEREEDAPWIEEEGKDLKIGALKSDADKFIAKQKKEEVEPELKPLYPVMDADDDTDDTSDNDAPDFTYVDDNADVPEIVDTDDNF